MENVNACVTVAKTYRDMLMEVGVKENREEKGSVEQPHLLWMLNEIINNKNMSIIKKNRWLGFIQGCLVKDGFLNIEKERNWTRNIFNGD